MRDLEQAKSEVFRRSSARIKKRKTIRRSIIACCVPLVLCVGIVSVSMLPGMMPGNGMDSAESAELYAIGTNGLTEDIKYGDAAPSFSLGGSLRGNEPKAVILVHGEECPLSSEDAEAIRSILKKLDYSPHRICRCLPECQFEMKSKSYGLHLGEGYARCEEGQARLTQEQLQTIREILSRNAIEIN